MGQIDDIPEPNVDELQQRAPELWAPEAVPVDVVGTPRVVLAGNRRWACFTTPLSTTKVNIVGTEPNRSCITLIADAAWSIANGKNGALVALPANVPIVFTHQGEIWASSSVTCNLAAFPEYHGD